MYLLSESIPDLDALNYLINIFLVWPVPKHTHTYLHWHPLAQYPVLVYVYGGPGSQMVTDSWGVGWGEYLVTSRYTALHCTALHCSSSLHCTALHWSTALHFTELLYKGRLCMQALTAAAPASRAMNISSRYRMGYTSLVQSITMQCSILQFITLSGSTVHYNILQYSAVQCSAMQSCVVKFNDTMYRFTEILAQWRWWTKGKWPGR